MREKNQTAQELKRWGLSFLIAAPFTLLWQILPLENTILQLICALASLIGGMYAFCAVLYSLPLFAQLMGEKEVKLTNGNILTVSGVAIGLGCASVWISQNSFTFLFMILTVLTPVVLVSFRAYQIARFKSE